MAAWLRGCVAAERGPYMDDDTAGKFMEREVEREARKAVASEAAHFVDNPNYARDPFFYFALPRSAPPKFIVRLYE